MDTTKGAEAAIPNGTSGGTSTVTSAAATATPTMRDSANPPKWVGMDVWAATICFNTAEAAKRNIPKPETWKDLTKPIYKEQIVMPHPASSGTGGRRSPSWSPTSIR